MMVSAEKSIKFLGEKVSQEEIAGLLGYSQGRISQVATGGKCPARLQKALYALYLEKVEGVTVVEARKRANMRTVMLDKAGIKSAIVQGDNYSGAWYLVVSPDGTPAVKWEENTRQWNPWGEDDQVFPIPPLDPDGSGRESEDAWDMLGSIATERPDELHAMGFKGEMAWYGENGIEEFLKNFKDEQNMGIAEICEQSFPYDWKVNREEAVDFLLNEFLDALNGFESHDCAGFYEESAQRFEYEYA
jgi:transcriptional regulator with XRE-family HTH domain